MTDLSKIASMKGDILLPKTKSGGDKIVKAAILERGGLKVYLGAVVLSAASLSLGSPVQIERIETEFRSYLKIRPDTDGGFNIKKMGRHQLGLHFGAADWLPPIVHPVEVCDHHLSGGVLAIQLPNWKAMQDEITRNAGG